MIQLSKNTHRLLSRVGGKPWAEQQKSPSEDIEDSSAGDVDSAGKKKLDKKHKKKLDPMSDDDSDDSNDAGRLDRGSIKPTSFVVSSKGAGIITQRQTYGDSSRGNVGGGHRQLSYGTKRRKLDEGSEAQPPPNSSQRTTSSESGNPPASSSEHMTDALGFSKRNKVTQTFGKGRKGTATAKRPLNSLEKKFGSFGNKSSGSQSKPKPKGILESPLESGDLMLTNSTAKAPPSTFKHFDAEYEEESSQGEEDAGFKKPKAIPDSPPYRASETKFKGIGAEESDSSLTTPKPKFKAQSPGASTTKSMRKKKKRSKRKSESPEAESKSQAPVFMAFDDDMGLTTPVKNAGRPGSPLSDLGSDDGNTQADPGDVEEATAPAATLCPWCGEPVDEQLLADFSKGKTRLNVRQQTRFCQKHRKHTAQETWTARSYPEIDWDELPDRIATHYDSLLDVINCDRPSHYRTRLADKIDSGQDRAMKKEENLNPGYYGPRGFNLMCDRLVDQFGDLLKVKAVQDRVISGRGSAAFIQSVLVAELAVQLIKDDMGVPVEEARVIMEESKAIGEMIHEEA